MRIPGFVSNLPPIDEGLILVSEPVMKPKGHIIINGQTVADTLQCCHCQGHWIPIRGSGKRRGFCMNCGSVTCGRPSCDRCLPWEKKLELIEKGKISGA